MGCSSSKSSTVAQRPVKKKSHKAIESIDEEALTEVDLEQMKLERRLRQEQEEQITNQLYAEKEALRKITSRLIERRVSCESLMDALDPHELLEISIDHTAYKAQKISKRNVIKRTQTTVKQWMVRVKHL